MGHPRTIALVLLALLLGAGLWLFLERGEQRSEGARALRRDDPPASVPTREEATLLAPSAPDVAPSERAPLAVEAEAQPENPAAPSGAGESVLVELVLLESGAPAALADVWYRDAEAGAELDFDDIDGQRLEGSGGLALSSTGGFRKEATKVRADERGLVRLPLVPGRSLQVLAQLDQHLGAKTIDHEPGAGRRERLELVHDWELQVRVLQASGEPAAKIQVFLRSEVGSSSWSTDDYTGADGLARFAHAGLRARQRAGASWVTGVSLPIAEPLERSFDPARPPAEPIVFRLPPLGEVEVLVLDERGEPMADGTDVRLGLVGPEQPRELSPFAHDERHYASETTRAGKALFRRVEPGFEVEIQVGRFGWQALGRGFFPGPVHAGERVQHVLRLGLDHPVLVFRAVDELAQPLRETELELAQWSHSGWNTSRTGKDTRTDAEGLFQVDLPAGWKEGDQHRLHVTAREGAFGAALDLSRAFENGRNAMGDLVLREALLLAAGRVVDAEGRGVVGAEVGLEYSHEDGGWDQPDLGVKSAAEGEFSVRGFVFGSRLRLTPREGGRAGAAVECAVGASGVQLVLVATGAVAGAVLLDEGVPAELIRLRLLAEGTEEEEESWWDADLAELAPSGEFRFADQLPGRYLLRIALEDDLELVLIPAVVVTSGETNRDARLAAIDLRRRLFLTRLAFVPPEPDSRLEGSLSYRKSGADEEDEHWHYFRGNPVELVTPYASLDLTCAVKGYRSVRLTHVNGEREVPLARALLVRLVLRADVTLPAPPTYLKATLVADEGGEEIDWGASVFDETRESVSNVGRTGRLRVQWMIEKRSMNGASATSIDIEPLQWVEVVDTDQEQRFELQVSPEALEKALAESPF